MAIKPTPKELAKDISNKYAIVLYESHVELCDILIDMIENGAAPLMAIAIVRENAKNQLEKHQ